MRAALSMQPVFCFQHPVKKTLYYFFDKGDFEIVANGNRNESYPGV